MEYCQKGVLRFEDQNFNLQGTEHTLLLNAQGQLMSSSAACIKWLKQKKAYVCSIDIFIYFATETNISICFWGFLFTE